ncbi:hypothetical protein NL676_032510 [Syzygium grande]|nr:hypothetical protein NL676_032510 [Syzygium grande]
MATVLGNIALLLDLNSPRASIPDRKSRPSLLDAVSGLTKREPQFASYYAALSPKGFEADGDAWSHRAVVARGKANSKVNGVDFGAGSSDEEGNGNGNGSGGGEDEEEPGRRRRRAEGSEGEGGGGEETEEEKKMRVRKELEKVAKEQAERRATAQLMFELGQKAYGKGMYGRAIEFLEGALTIIPRFTLFGGEIQIWLAMAYEANNRHADCIALYQQLEKKHPIISIRRQAAELKYILQAPKLKISQEEMVTIPLIGSSYDSYAATWSGKYKDKDQNSSFPTTNQLPSSRDFLGDFLSLRRTAERRLPLTAPEMTTRFKKNRKKRGHVSAGHGRIGKHRKHPGGRGNAGGMHHHRILFDKYHPGYFGKVGMRYFHKLRNKFYCPIVNVERLWSLVPQAAKDKASGPAAAPVVDVTQFGYFKVLGKGVLPEKQPIVVKAKLVSKIAEKKIKEAGGAVVLTA